MKPIPVIWPPTWIFILLLGIVFAGLYTLYDDRAERNLILDNYLATEGKVTDFTESISEGLGTSYNIEYAYTASDSMEYKGQTSISRRDFPVGSKCYRMRYWVIHSQTDPSKSLINLCCDIRGVENPAFPKSLDEFN